MGFAFTGDDTQHLEVRVVTQGMVTLRERDNERQRQIEDPIAELSCSRVGIANGEVSMPTSAILPGAALAKEEAWLRSRELLLTTTRSESGEQVLRAMVTKVSKLVSAIGPLEGLSPIPRRSSFSVGG
jgi:hypothetical protein